MENAEPTNLIHLHNTLLSLHLKPFSLFISNPSLSRPHPKIPAIRPSFCLENFNLTLYVTISFSRLRRAGKPPIPSVVKPTQPPRRRIKKGSFFNWFYFSINIGALISSSLIVWIQDNAGWGLGFGIPALFMGFAIVSFFSGTNLYRFQRPGGSPITRMCQVLVASFRKWNLVVPDDSSLLYELPDKSSAIEGSRKLLHTDELK